jgi:1-acyl-sn-glycerol-3-phosphate acyltransferase
MIFTRREFDELVLGHLRTHLKNFGVFLNLLLTPLKAFFVNYISSNIVKIGTIPVDLYNKKRETIGVVEDYLRKGRSIIALQGRGRVMPKDPHPYVKRFSGGTSVIVYNLLQEEISVPITPIAMFGTQIPIFVPGKIHVNVGQPLYIKDYFTGEFQETVEKFKIALESSVKNLFREFLNH